MLLPELRDRLAALLLLQPRHQATKSPLLALADLGLSPCRGNAWHLAVPVLGAESLTAQPLSLLLCLCCLWATYLGQYPC